MAERRLNPKRCRCHSDPVYDGLRFCPKCGHWSFDPYADSCERKGCGYVLQERKDG